MSEKLSKKDLENANGAGEDTYKYSFYWTCLSETIFKRRAEKGGFISVDDAYNAMNEKKSSIERDHNPNVVTFSDEKITQEFFKKGFPN